MQFEFLRGFERARFALNRMRSIIKKAHRRAWVKGRRLVGRNYILGTPLHAAQCQTFAKKLYLRYCHTGRGWEHVHEYIIGGLGRVTDKSVGILQLNSIMMAAVAFAIEKSRISYAILLILSTSSILLTTNLFVNWKKNDLYYRWARRDAMQNLLIWRARSLRLTACLFMTVAAFFLIVMAILFSGFGSAKSQARTELPTNPVIAQTQRPASVPADLRNEAAAGRSKAQGVEAPTALAEAAR